MIAASQIFTQKTFCEQKNHNKKMEFTTNFFMYSDNLLFLLCLPIQLTFTQTR